MQRTNDDATRDDTMGGNSCNKNWKYKAAWFDEQVGEDYCNVLNLFNTINITNPSCANPQHLYATVFVDSTASTLLVQDLAPDVANIQEPNFYLTMPNRGNTKTEATMCLWLAKLPPHAWGAFLLKNLQQNLLAVSELCDVWCSHFSETWGGSWIKHVNHPPRVAG